MPIRRFPLVAVVSAVAAGPAVGCPFCSAQGQTLSGEVAQADLIVLGRLTNARPDPADFTRGTTDLAVDAVVKPHPFVAGKPALTIPRYVPPDPRADRYLVFANVYPKPAGLPLAVLAGTAPLGDPAVCQLDPYRGEPVPPGSKLPGYLTGAMAVRDKPVADRLRYFFGYLDAADPAIAADALMEFGNASYPEVRAVAGGLPADKLAGWLADPSTPPSRLGLYGLLLGHCGTAAHAAAVRALLADPARPFTEGLDGVLTAYVMLDKPAGWAHLTALAADPKKEFAARNAALRTLRFFWEYRPDVAPRGEVRAALRPLVADPDMADMPIEDLRKWGCWDEAEYVLSFADAASHYKVPIVRRAILRYALSAPPGTPGAAAVIARARRTDPDRVKQVEELLKDEKPAPLDPATPTPAVRPRPPATP